MKDYCSFPLCLRKTVSLYSFCDLACCVLFVAWSNYDNELPKESEIQSGKANSPKQDQVTNTKCLYWSFAEKTFVKQSMMLCAFEILLKNGHKTGGNRSSMNLSNVVSHAWAVTHVLSSATGHAWVVTRERPGRYKSTNLVIILARPTFIMRTKIPPHLHPSRTNLIVTDHLTHCLNI